MLAGAACFVAAVGVLRIPGADDAVPLGPIAAVEPSAA
jgi:hypothetical protein